MSTGGTGYVLPSPVGGTSDSVVLPNGISGEPKSTVSAVDEQISAVYIKSVSPFANADSIKAYFRSAVLDKCSSSSENRTAADDIISVEFKQYPSSVQRYCKIVFGSSSGVTAAIQMNGTLLHGVPTSISVIDPTATSTTSVSFEQHIANFPPGPGQQLATLLSADTIDVPTISSIIQANPNILGSPAAASSLILSLTSPQFEANKTTVKTNALAALSRALAPRRGDMGVSTVSSMGVSSARESEAAQIARTVYIGGLPPKWTSNELLPFVSVVLGLGSVTDFRIEGAVENPFALIEFASPQSVLMAFAVPEAKRVVVSPTTDGSMKAFNIYFDRAKTTVKPREPDNITFTLNNGTIVPVAYQTVNKISLEEKLMRVKRLAQKILSEDRNKTQPVAPGVDGASSLPVEGVSSGSQQQNVGSSSVRESGATAGHGRAHREQMSDDEDSRHGGYRPSGENNTSGNLQGSRSSRKRRRYDPYEGDSSRHHQQSSRRGGGPTPSSSVDEHNNEYNRRSSTRNTTSSYGDHHMDSSSRSSRRQHSSPPPPSGYHHSSSSWNNSRSSTSGRNATTSRRNYGRYEDHHIQQSSNNPQTNGKEYYSRQSLSSTRPTHHGNNSTVDYQTTSTMMEHDDDVSDYSKHYRRRHEDYDDDDHYRHRHSKHSTNRTHAGRTHDGDSEDESSTSRRNRHHHSRTNTNVVTEDYRMSPRSSRGERHPEDDHIVISRHHNNRHYVRSNSPQPAPAPAPAPSGGASNSNGRITISSSDRHLRSSSSSSHHRHQNVQNNASDEDGASLSENDEIVGSSSRR